MSIRYEDFSKPLDDFLSKDFPSNTLKVELSKYKVPDQLLKVFAKRDNLSGSLSHEVKLVTTKEKKGIGNCNLIFSDG